MKRYVWLVIGMAMLVAGCVHTSATPSGITPVDADAVHQQWVSGLEHDNYDQVYEAMVPIDNKELLTQLMLEHAREWHTDEGIAGTHGSLLNVELLPVLVSETNAKGISVWHHQRGVWCLITHLRLTDKGWRVLNYGTDTDCTVLEHMHDRT